ncbi:uncharacterized protein LOC122004672 [Zingiber officinale]|uniref:uncharacterized protein LOC122004672 n=1 Tax=Zingiber officinale TaxID=94328 RepID=UPI001C4CB3D2|nr:uncharacterized protein LOC122004672 [Zingiber officinale]
MPKHSFTLWLFAHERLRTKDRKPDVQCKTLPLCQDANETFNHLFFRCPISMVLWAKVRAWLGMCYMSTTKRIMQVFKRRIQENSHLTKDRCNKSILQHRDDKRNAGFSTKQIHSITEITNNVDLSSS